MTICNIRGLLFEQQLGLIRLSVQTHGEHMANEFNFERAFPSFLYSTSWYGFIRSNFIDTVDAVASITGEIWSIYIKL